MCATCPAGDSLQKLTLNDNPILELDKDSFRGLLLLQELNISAMSRLTRIGPATFTHLRSLEVLFCSYNHNLTDIDEDAFGYVDNEWTLKEVQATFCLMFMDLCSIVQFIQKNPTRCNSVSKFIIPCLYEAQRVSGDTPPIIRSLKLH